MASSIASVPELVKNTVSAKVSATSFLRQAFLARHAVEVGGVPELARLLGQRRHQPGMGMAEGVDRDAGAEIQISLAILGEKVGALATDEGDIRPVIGGKQSGKHGALLLCRG